MREVKTLQSGLTRPRLEQIRVQNNQVGLQMPFLEHDLMGLGIAKRKFSFAQVLFIFRQVVEQVRRLHGAGLVHRDIKSSNILLGTQAEPSLIDFGHTVSARHAKRHFQCGTLIYMSPELLLSRATKSPSDDYFAADMWALGCVLVELLIGRPLFATCKKSTVNLAKSWELLFGQHPLAGDLRKALTTPEAPLKALTRRFSLRKLILKKCPEASLAVLGLVEKLLQPDPKERPSCDDVLVVLKGQAEKEEEVGRQLREELGALKESCLEHRVRERLLAKRGYKRALTSRGANLSKRVGLGDQSSASRDSGLKRVKAANTESLALQLINKSQF